MIRDGKQAFVGSQSLRALELDARREVGIVFQEPEVVARLAAVFRSDWEAASMPDQAAPDAEPLKKEKPPAAKVAKKVARAVVKDLSPVTPVVEMTVKEVAGIDAQVELKRAITDLAYQAW
jgi:hypothetical protein